jgi:hypothetical protein
MIKVFSSREYLHPLSNYAYFLYPIWGANPVWVHDDLRSRALIAYTERGKEFVISASLEDADIAVLPGNWGSIIGNQEATDLAIKFADKVSGSGKPLVVFVSGDHYWKVPFPCIAFRTTIYKSRSLATDFSMPEWTGDITHTDLAEILPIRKKSLRPRVGFCGYAPPIGIPFGKEALKSYIRMGLSTLNLSQFAPHLPRHAVRARAIYALSKSPLIETEFFVRGGLSFTDKGLHADQLVNSAANKAAASLSARKQFVQNLVHCDYALCARGHGNYSFRFYEALSVGRIPIFINTDCALPYEDKIDWKRYCIWVEEREISKLPEIVADFHERISEREFIELQYECRKLWDSWVSPVAYFRNFHRYFDKYSMYLAT